MYIYKLIMKYECEESTDGVGYVSDFLTHNKYFSKKEYDECVQEALKHNENILYNVKKYLIDKYGFENINYEQEYEFEEKY